MTETNIPINTTDQTPDPQTDKSKTIISSAPGDKRWPGWPGDCVFRVIVPVLKVGSIIGRKGDLIKKMSEDTKARIRVLDGPLGNPDRIVLISGKEETEAPLSPAMDAVMKVFKRVNGFPEDGSSDSVASIPFCSIRLLIPPMQAISLIGKQGSSIKTIQETTGCSVRVLSTEGVTTLYANPDDKIVDLQGEPLIVLKALEAVVGHLRKFLVDHSVIPLYETTHNAQITQENKVDPWAESMANSISHAQVGSDYPLSLKRESLFLDRGPQRDSRLSLSEFMFHGRDRELPPKRSPALGLSSSSFVTQVAQTMQIPLVYAEGIIGVGGTNIAYIRRTSGAALSVQETQGLPDEFTVEIKGTSSQVQTAQQLIEECVNNHRESNMDSGLRSSYSRFTDSSYSRQSYDGYGMSGLGDYSSYRM